MAAKPRRKAAKKSQSDRFREAARKLEAAGELNLTEAAAKFERAVKKILAKKND